MDDTEKLGFPTSQETLHKAMLEADLLLAYACSHALALDQTVVADIVQSRQLLNADPADPATYPQQIAFWRARNALAATVRPISATSLKQSTFQKQDTTFGARWQAKLFGRPAPMVTGVEMAIRKTQLRLILPIALLLVLQIFTLIGATVVRELHPSLKQMSGMLAEQEKLAHAEETEANLRARAALDNQIALAASDLQIRVKLLIQWNTGWQWLAGPFSSPGERKGDAALAAATPIERYQLIQSTVLGAQFALNVLQSFILPLLYGCLGASLFVLRSLAADAKEHTFDLERQVVYNLRLFMGTLCGLVMAWLVPGTVDASGVKGMSPYTLSVVAGYGVDIVFAFMDKIISSFSSGTDKGKGADK
jgi:hypothetical protein